MEKLLEQIEEFKKQYQSNLENGEKIIDINYYGQINLSKNDRDKANERKEHIYLIKKEQNGKSILEFYTKSGKIAGIGEAGQIEINTKYKQLINEKEILLQLQKVTPISLKKLEEQLRNNKERTKESKKEQSTTKKQEQLEEKVQIGHETKTNEKQYKPKAKDIKINMNTKITKTSTFKELVPEVGQKGIQDVIVRRTDATKFEFIGIDSYGNEIPIETLKQTEGTNPTKDIITINGNGQKVNQSQAMTILKIQNGQNQGKQNEGFTISLGAYGIPEVNYYRRAQETNEYTSVPVNLEHTNQKRTDLKVREYIEKKSNTTVNDNIIKAQDRIEANQNKQTTLENIDDNPYNDKIVDEAEIQIRKAAKRCKISVEAFKEEIEKVTGDSLEEKIENAEENINEQYIGQGRQRA